jgi:hypothetical protein
MHVETRLHLGGEWRDGGVALPVTNPARDVVIASVATALVEDYLDAVACRWTPSCAGS